MVAKGIQLYCNNEHGFGDVSFPEDGMFQTRYRNAAHLRREARKSGWKRMNGGDYCPSCVACEEDREAA